jgi:hypothetical protein
MALWYRTAYVDNQAVDKDDIRDGHRDNLIIPTTIAALRLETTLSHAYYLIEGRIWALDAADTSTADDGTSCVVSASGQRYKLQALGGAPSGDIVGTTDSQTLTNKTIALGSNTVSGTIAQFQSAVTDATLLTTADEGSGNGLDADTLDGVQGANYARTDVAETFTADVEIETGSLTLNGNAIYAEEVTIADDAFATITPQGRYGGFVIITSNGNDAFPQTSESVARHIDFGSSPELGGGTTGANAAAAITGPPTGTTGADNSINVFAGGTSGSFYIENRRGSTKSFQVVVL